MNNEATMFALWPCVLIRASSLIRHSCFVIPSIRHSFIRHSFIRALSFLSFVLHHSAHSSF